DLDAPGQACLQQGGKERLPLAATNRRGQAVPAPPHRTEQLQSYGRLCAHFCGARREIGEVALGDVDPVLQPAVCEPRPALRCAVRITDQPIDLEAVAVPVKLQAMRTSPPRRARERVTSFVGAAERFERAGA